jgi:tetratricopeptide (TPR) repeat protein
MAFRALSLYYTGHTDQAAEQMELVVKNRPHMYGIRPFLAMALSAQGKHEQALAQISKDVRRNGKVDPDIAYSIASVYALENMRDEAFDWLGRAISLGNENRPCFDNDPNWAALRDDERFAELMKRVHPGQGQSKQH